MRWMERLLDRRLAKVRRQHQLPDLPEIRRFCRLSWLSGFCGFFGAGMGRQVAEARKEALAAIGRAAPGNSAEGGEAG
jgi:hypothetical protein